MWSKTKKKLEDLLCDSLKEHLEYHCSNYRIHDSIGRAYITVDKKEVLNMCTLKRDYYQDLKDGCFSQVEFMNAAFEFLNSPINKSLESQDPIVRLLAILDRRVGKRTLEALKAKMQSEDEMINYFFKLRCGLEGIDV